MTRYSIEIKGIVQGVGFRPFVFRLAQGLSLGGFVRNTAGGALVEIEGEKENCSLFISRLKTEAHSPASISEISKKEMPPLGEKSFNIHKSSYGTPDAFISPDIGMCAGCERDINDKDNLRYNYAFTSCAVCGPRFTVIRDVPYDRENTSMGVFDMCSDCTAEYDNELDRRFHAQTNACPICGPQLSFYRDEKLVGGDPYALFKKAVSNGETVAVKGIGGYHLVCDAENEDAVQRLRERKARYEKPFAVMARDIEAAKKYCEINDLEGELLSSVQKPIVLLKKKKDCAIATGTAPENSKLGIMLPYTPLHAIILRDFTALVMTSANVSDSPMLFGSGALCVLTKIADAVLTHDREIERRMDDSVCFVCDGRVRFIRRARGYVPEPFGLYSDKNLLALGAQQKNTFCLVKNSNAFLSGHIGDLDDMDTARSFENEINSFKRIFGASPDVVVRDAHPDYISSRYAKRFEKTLPVIEVLHHHAHFASVLAEHGIQGRAAGFIFDGAGYGADGCVWGGEMLYGDAAESERVGHLLYFPLLGGDMAAKEPYRCAAAAVDMAAGKEAAVNLFPEYAESVKMLQSAYEKGVNSPLTSSMGRLFDAVSALLNIRTRVSYEGQAAVELQQVADETAAGKYSFAINEKNGVMIFDWRPVIKDILADIKRNVPKGDIAYRFHRAADALTVTAAELFGKKTGCSTVVLSGGVFQNDLLLKNALSGLREKGFKAYANERVPANDAGISFGQAAAAAGRME